MGGTCPWGNVHAWSLCVLPFCVNSFNCGWLKVLSSWSEPCGVHPHGCAAACISPQSNDYMCAKTHLPPPPSHQHLLGCVVAAFSPAILPPPPPCSVHSSSAAAGLYGRPGSDTSRAAFHYSLFSFPARDSFLSGSHLGCTECLFPAGRCERGLSEQQGWGRRGGYGNLANRAERKGGRLDTNCSRWSESRRVFVDRGGSFIHAEIAAQPNAWRSSSLRHVLQEKENPPIAVFIIRSPDWLGITDFAWSAGLFCDRLERDE